MFKFRHYNLNPSSGSNKQKSTKEWVKVWLGERIHQIYSSLDVQQFRKCSSQSCVWFFSNTLNALFESAYFFQMPRTCSTVPSKLLSFATTRVPRGCGRHSQTSWRPTRLLRHLLKRPSRLPLTMVQNQITLSYLDRQLWIFILFIYL